VDVLTVEGSDWTVTVRDVAHQDLACLPNVLVLRLAESEYESTSAVLLTGLADDRERWSLVITAVGGATGIHDHSAIAVQSAAARCLPRRGTRARLKVCRPETGHELRGAASADEVV